MTYEVIVTLSVLAMFLGAVMLSVIAVDIALIGSMTLLLLFGVLSPVQAFAGFANPALVIIACFYIVSAAIKETGAINWWVMRCLGNSDKPIKVLPRVILPVSAISSIMSNTPVVAIMIPQLQAWARRHNVAPSKLLMPLSFAAMLGGTCSLIGTSTNILLVGLMESSDVPVSLNLFSPALVGIPLVMLCCVYFMTIGARLLPARGGADEVIDGIRYYSVSMRVNEDSQLVGKSIEDAGLRRLEYCFLSEVQAGSRVIPAVGPNEILHANDVLIFTGQPESVRELRGIRGLAPVEDNARKLDAPISGRELLEAVIAPASNMVGKSVKESKFRTTYGGAILAISRQGKRISKKIGDIVLHQGDTLLIEASKDFVTRHRYKRDFLLLVTLGDNALPDLSKGPVATGLLLGFLVIVILGLLPLATASLALVCCLGITKCISLENAQRSVDLRILAAIGGSIALGLAIQNTGIASMAANAIASLADNHAYLSLIFLYIVTVIVTELITNNAAAVIMFPVAMGLSTGLGVSITPFVMTIMFAASMSFLTPYGYQTNLMVQGPGEYRAADYARVGGLLSIFVGAIVIGLVPIFWPF